MRRPIRCTASPDEPNTLISVSRIQREESAVSTIILLGLAIHYTLKESADHSLLVPFLVAAVVLISRDVSLGFPVVQDCSQKATAVVIQLLGCKQDGFT